MITIPIGIQCTNGRFLQLADKRKMAFPFDYMFSTPKLIFEMLQLLLEKNIKIEELVLNHFFYVIKE